MTICSLLASWIEFVLHAPIIIILLHKGNPELALSELGVELMDDDIKKPGNKMSLDELLMQLDPINTAMSLLRPFTSRKSK